MIVIPAIDLMNGKAVRLEQGEASRATEYHDNPVRLMTEFARSGAQRIHVVDLDGAFAGYPQQLELIARLSDAAMAHGSTVQAGGGLRSTEAIESLLNIGVSHAVVGTLAIREPETVERLCQAHPSQIIIAADARDRMVAIEGWTQDSTISAQTLAHQAERWGAAAVLYTDVHRDGMQDGPNIPATTALQQDLGIPVIASGGVGRLSDLDACAKAGIQGVILGRALYEQAFTLEEALTRC